MKLKAIISHYILLPSPLGSKVLFNSSCMYVLLLLLVVLCCIQFVECRRSAVHSSNKVEYNIEGIKYICTYVAATLV